MSSVVIAAQLVVSPVAQAQQRATWTGVIQADAKAAKSMADFVVASTQFSSTALREWMKQKLGPLKQIPAPEVKVLKKGVIQLTVQGETATLEVVRPAEGVFLLNGEEVRLDLQTAAGVELELQRVLSVSRHMDPFFWIPSAHAVGGVVLYAIVAVAALASAAAIGGILYSMGCGIYATFTSSMSGERCASAVEDFFGKPFRGLAPGVGSTNGIGALADAEPYCRASGAIELPLKGSQLVTLTPKETNVLTDFRVEPFSMLIPMERESGLKSIEYKFSGGNIVSTVITRVSGEVIRVASLQLRKQAETLGIDANEFTQQRGLLSSLAEVLSAAQMCCTHRANVKETAAYCNGAYRAAVRRTEKRVVPKVVAQDSEGPASAASASAQSSAAR